VEGVRVVQGEHEDGSLGVLVVAGGDARHPFHSYTKRTFSKKVFFYSLRYYHFIINVVNPDMESSVPRLDLIH
jgi:hypothetical protein